MSWVAAGVAVVGGGIKLYQSLSDEKKAKQEQSQLKQPFMKVRDEYFQNRNIAESEAQYGFGQTEQDQFSKQTTKALQSGLSGLLSISNDPNQVSKLLDSFSSSVGGFEAASSEKQSAKISQFMAANKDLAGQFTTQWGVNEYGPYQNKLKEITERRAAAKLNEFSAMDEITSGAITGITYKNNLNSMLKQNNAAGNANNLRPATLGQVQPVGIPGNTSGNLPPMTPATLDLRYPDQPNAFSQNQFSPDQE